MYFWLFDNCTIGGTPTTSTVACCDATNVLHVSQWTTSDQCCGTPMGDSYTVRGTCSAVGNVFQQSSCVAFSNNCPANPGVGCSGSNADTITIALVFTGLLLLLL